jgi:hypothetical protein
MKLQSVLLTLSMMMPITAMAMENATLIYRESTGSNHEEIAYELTSRGAKMHIRADFNDEYQVIVTDDSLDTEKLEISFPKNPTVISIYREDDVLVIDGGHARSIAADPDIPWYQLLISLKGFVLSGEMRRSFYALSANFDERLSRGKGIQLLRLVAKRDGRETLEINGKSEETVRLVVTFDDIRSLFWKANYWYRESDGTLLQYREVRGGPGTAATMGILIEEGPRHE